MGLLDSFFGNADQTQAMGLLGANMMQGNTGKGFADAIQYMGGSKERAMNEQYKAMQIQNLQAEAQARQIKAQQEQAALQRAQAIQQAMPGLFGMQDASGSPQGGPQGVPMGQPEGQPGQAPMPQGAGGFDARRAALMGMDPDLIQKYVALQNAGRQEVARTVNVPGPNGEKMLQQIDKFGQPVGKPMTEFEAAQIVNLGNRQAAVVPRAGMSLPMGQSPDSVASNALTRRGQDMTDARARATAETGSIPSGYRRAMTGGLEYIPGGPADPNTPKSKANLTEDQGKATGWLVQAENAWKNMQATGLDKEGKVQGAAKPGVNDALAAVPVIGGLANTLRTEDRQKYMQASSSLSEALLRAATGAGVNHEEAAQKIRELTPVFGDTDAVIQQKMAAVPLYLESLRVRAGPGAVKADAITGNSGAPAANLPKPMKGMTRNGYRFKGGDPSDQSNWEKM